MFNIIGDYFIGILDKNGRLSEEARIRALSCLDRFTERVQKLPQGSVAAVGTNTLRQEDAEILHWASSLHEIGLAVSLSGYQKHGAYLLEKAELPGFSLEEQAWMSVLVRCHRKKISKKIFRGLPEKDQETALRLAILLRLATLLHRSRKDETAVIEQVVASENTLTLHFAQYELINHPLQRTSLEQEAKYLKNVGFNLRFKPTKINDQVRRTHFYSDGYTLCPNA